MKRTLLTLLAVFFLSVLPAVADPIDFTFAFSGSGINATGTLAAVATSTAGQYQMTGITGTVNGSAISFLDVNQYYSNDNLLTYPANGSPYLDVQGVSFADANGIDYNLYSYGVVGSYYFEASDGTSGSNDRFEIASSAVTPEPSSFLMLGTGCWAWSAWHAAGLSRLKLLHGAGTPQPKGVGRFCLGGLGSGFGSDSDGNIFPDPCSLWERRRSGDFGDGGLGRVEERDRGRAKAVEHELDVEAFHADALIDVEEAEADGTDGDDEDRHEEVEDEREDLEEVGRGTGSGLGDHEADRHLDGASDHVERRDEQAEEKDATLGATGEVLAAGMASRTERSSMTSTETASELRM